MLRIFSLLVAAVLVAPVGLAAQVEIGVDGGFVLDNYDEVETDFGSFGPDDLTTIAFPTPWLRVAFGATDMISIETAAALNRISSDGDALTTILLLPGVNVRLGEGGFYVRGEAGLQRSSYSPDEGDGDSVTQLAAGGAVGLKRPIADGPVAFRLEGGFGKFFEKEDEAPGFTRIRVLVGISATVN